MHDVRERLAAFAEHRPALSIALEVQERFSEVHGSGLAASVTLAAFLSLFPLLLVGVAVVGFFASNRADLASEVIELFGLSAADDAAGLVTSALATAEESRATASVVGFAGLLWSSLGLVGAMEYAYNSVWQVQGRGLKDKLFGVAWLAGAGLVFVCSFAVTAVLNFLPAFFAPVNLVVGLAVNTLLFLWAGKVLCNRDVGWRALLPGAVFAAIGLEVLKVVGGIWVPQAVASSSAVYGSIGIIFAILAWLLFFGRLVVYSATLNVVLWERRHGTVSVELEAPRLPGTVPLGATRAGETTESQPATS